MESEKKYIKQDRLTIRNGDGSVSQPLDLKWAEALEKLADYEDSGLTPEEVGKIVRAKNNHTKFTPKGTIKLSYSCPVCNAEIQYSEITSADLFHHMYYDKAHDSFNIQFCPFCGIDLSLFDKKENKMAF